MAVAAAACLSVFQGLIRMLRSFTCTDTQITKPSLPVYVS